MPGLVGTEESGFFNAEELSDGSYDRVYVSEQFSDYFALFVGNGVFVSPTDQLLVSSVSEGESGSMKVSVAPGWAFINGMWYHNKLEKQLDISLNLESENRTDGIFCQFIKANRNIKVVAVEGRTTPIRTEQQWELLLATVTVPTGTNRITNAEIADRRPDESVCGFVKGLVDVITTDNLFQQFEATFNQWFEASGDSFDEWKKKKKNDFDSWFDGIQSSLEGDVAANLTAQIAKLRADKADRYKRYSVDLLAESWQVSDTSAYIDVTGIDTITGHEEVKVLPKNSWTDAQKKMWMGAQILTGGLISGGLRLYSIGTVPTSDLEVDILVGSALDVKSGNLGGAVEVIGSAGGGGGSAGGITRYGTDLNSLANGSDSYAQYDGNVISAAISNQGYKFFETTFEDLTLGKYSVIMRAKVTNNSSAEQCLQINVRENDASGTVLATRNVSLNMFAESDKYDTLGFTFNFNSAKDTKLYIVGKMVGTTSGVNMSLDYISLMPAFTSMSEI